MKQLRNPAFEFRYQVTPFDRDENSLDSQWATTKKEANEIAIKILNNPQLSSVVNYVMCDNCLNDKLSFKVTRL